MFNFSKEKILVGDIGGTKTRLAIVEEKLNKIIYDAIFDTKNISDISETIKNFINTSKFNSRDIRCICLGIAAPLINNRTVAKLTNAELNIDSKEIFEKTGIKTFLINDFEAIIFSIDKITNFEEITSIGRNNYGTTAVIGPGTGLGAGIGVLINNKRIPIPSEAGHSDLIIDYNNKIELKLYKYLIKNKINLEFESILSGRGILLIYDFLLKEKLKHSPKIHAEIKNSEDKSKTIITNGVNETDVLCINVVKLFVSFYARFCRNFILSTGSSELILTGNINKSLIPILRSEFLEIFVNHPIIPSRKMLENTSIIVTWDNLTIQGCIEASKYK